MSRIMIAAAHKSSGKTVISTGLAAAMSKTGGRVQTFKKGPDYIDPMWLAAASGRPCYNLDFNIMDKGALVSFFRGHAATADISLIETNKGLFDGVALDGSDCNAELTKILDVPVILVIDTNGITRGIAPLLLGYQAFDPAVNIAGVILNRVGGARHEGKLRAAVETYTDLPVLGAVWRNPDLDIGERHLGLTTPAELPDTGRKIDGFARVIAASIDLDAVLSIANAASPLIRPAVRNPKPPAAPKVRIGIARDRAFGFYYPDDIQAFADAGAELVSINTLSDASLPRIDGLFIGGGFPETQMPALSANTSLRAEIRTAINAGLPTYAECGGLMYLCQSLSWQGARFDMVGAVPGDAVMHEKPQGRGYARFTRLPDHPWRANKAEVVAHEFHYASIENLPDGVRYGRSMTRGAGINGKSDGIVLHNLFAGFCHLRSSPTNPWVRDFVAFVRSNKVATGGTKK